MDIFHSVILQRNHVYLKANLQVDPVLDALYQGCVFTQEDFDRCRLAAPERQCELFLEILKKKGVEGYRTLCAVLDSTQQFIKEKLDETSTEEGSSDLVYVNKEKLEAHHKKQLAEKDGKIADMHSAMERLEEQVQQKHTDYAELEEQLIKERGDLTTQIEKKNEEVETLKTTLSKANDELLQIRAKCETVEKVRLDQLKCLKCYFAHKGHENEDMNPAYVKAKGQLEEQVQQQRLKLKDVKDRMGTVTTHQTELGIQQGKLEQDATTVFKSVAVRFLHRQRQLMKDIHASLQAPNEMVKEKLDTLHDVHTSIVSTIDYTQRTLESTRQEELIALTAEALQKKSDENLNRKLPEDDTQDTRVLLTFQGQKALMELIDTFGGLASSLDLDNIPDKQPTLQDLHKQNQQLALKEEETRAVHGGRWHRLGEMIRRITGSDTSGDGSQGLQPEQLTPQDLRHEQLTPQDLRHEQLTPQDHRHEQLTPQDLRHEQLRPQERRPQQLTPQEVYEVTCFILGASFLSESPSRGLLLRGYSHHIRQFTSSARTEVSYSSHVLNSNWTLLEPTQTGAM